MLRAALVGIAFVGTLAAARTPAAPATFSMVIESTPHGWAARCDSGCRWTDVSFACERACGAIIDANGVVTLASADLDSSSFRFVVERKDSVVHATARTGTAWEKLTWSCTTDPCRVRVDPYGVSGILRAR